MKVRLPLMSIDARGRFEHAFVYSFHRGLNIVRKFVTPANPQTARQSLVRSYLTALVGSWSLLLLAYRETWNVYAEGKTRQSALGTAYKPTGRNFYIGCGSVAKDLGLTPSETAPTFPVPASEEFVITNPVAQQLLITLGHLDTGKYAGVWITPLPIQNAQTVTPGKLRWYKWGAVSTKTIVVTGLGDAGETYGVGVKVADVKGQLSTFIIKRGSVQE